MFGLGREAYLGGDIDYDADNIRFNFVDAADYTISIDTHQALDDVTGAGIVATSANLSSKTKTLGTADAADETISTVTGDPFELIIFYLETGTASTSLLFLALDTATGLPTTPNGSDITLQFDSGADRIFTL